MIMGQRRNRFLQNNCSKFDLQRWQGFQLQGTDNNLKTIIDLSSGIMGLEDLDGRWHRIIVIDPITIITCSNTDDF